MIINAFKNKIFPLYFQKSRFDDKDENEEEDENENDDDEDDSDDNDDEGDDDDDKLYTPKGTLIKIPDLESEESAKQRKN